MNYKFIYKTSVTKHAGQGGYKTLWKLRHCINTVEGFNGVKEHYENLGETVELVRVDPVE